MYKDYTGLSMNANLQLNIKMIEEVNVQGTKNIVKGNKMQLCMICVQCMYI